jgi:hypothetical protein
MAKSRGVMLMTLITDDRDEAKEEKDKSAPGRQARGRQKPSIKKTAPDQRESIL